MCSVTWNEAFGNSVLRNDFLTLSVVFISLPFTLIVALYSILLLKLKLQKTPGEQLANAKEHRARRQRNVLKMATAIILGFAICWLPLDILVSFSFFSGTKMTCKVLHYGRIAYLIAHANCAINSCICYGFSVNFRQALKSILMGSI